MAESGNRAVRIEITGDAVPTGKPVVGTKLHHAEGSLGAGISVSGEVSSDKWIYIRFVAPVMMFILFLQSTGILS